MQIEQLNLESTLVQRIMMKNAEARNAFMLCLETTIGSCNLHHGTIIRVIYYIDIMVTNFSSRSDKIKYSQLSILSPNLLNNCPIAL